MTIEEYNDLVDKTDKLYDFAARLQDAIRKDGKLFSKSLCHQFTSRVYPFKNEPHGIVIITSDAENNFAELFVPMEAFLNDDVDGYVDYLRKALDGYYYKPNAKLEDHEEDKERKHWQLPEIPKNIRICD